jgi:hypothetical protein
LYASQADSKYSFIVPKISSGKIFINVSMYEKFKSFEELVQNDRKS